MSPAPARSDWILSRRWDLALFICTPVLAVVTLIPLARYFPSAEFGAFLLAFFTFGHHLPGFMRAYGDRDLFRQYKMQFLLAPPVVFAVTLWAARHDLHGLLFVAFTWDIWHVLMQQYGFLRIYDAKSARVDPWSARLDRALALSWYLTFIALSPHYTHDLFLRAYSTGIPAISPGVLSTIQLSLVVASAAITAMYIFSIIRDRHRGYAPNWRKVLALGCFLSATWYLYVIYPDFVVGFAVWSAFHCVQYYGIVWAYNRSRVLKAPGVGTLLRFLFRPRLALVLLYAAMIFAYGGLNWVARYLPKGRGLELLMAFVITSGVLHYYYDGFIWRVRDRGLRRVLSINDTGAAPILTPLRHPAIAQAAIASLAIAACLWLEFRSPYDATQVRRSLALTIPFFAFSQRNYANTLREKGAYADAAAVYRKVLEIDGSDATAFHQYGLTLAAMGQERGAEEAFERALASDPRMKAAHYNLASLLVRRGETVKALEHFRSAVPAGDDRALEEIEAEPGASDALTNLALGLIQNGQHQEAMALLRRVVNTHPDNAAAQLNLASLLVMTGNRQEANVHYQAAIASGNPSIRAAAEGALSKLR